LASWLPFPTGWAYLTGAGKIACGIGVLFSIYPRVAAAAETGMLSLFTLLVWGPAILAAPRARLPWKAFSYRGQSSLPHGWSYLFSSPIDILHEEDHIHTDIR
jgi:uncharacterized membrane protein YphA (DoxX/SURF4 family)